MQQQIQTELWVLEAQAGDLTAFEKLYQHYTPLVSAYLYKRTSSQSLVQDAVQEAWLSLAKNLKQLQDPAAFKPWLFQKAHWALLDMVKKQQSYRETSDQVIQEAGIAPTEAHSDNMARALAQLPATEKDIIHLFYLEGFSVNEIAQILAIPTGTVKSRLYRARQQLQALLKEE